jgi:hypothetical protein
VLVLDTKAVGALFGWRLCCGCGCLINGATATVDIDVTVRNGGASLYGAPSQAAYCDSAPAGDKQRHLNPLDVHHRQLQVWAENCPKNFENRAALVGAEISRLGGRELDAERLYEHAVRSARANGFIHNEALANEIAARFYAARAFEKIARVYLRDARYGYLRWGANGKVRQLDEMYPPTSGRKRLRPGRRARSGHRSSIWISRP